MGAGLLRKEGEKPVTDRRQEVDKQQEWKWGDPLRGTRSSDPHTGPTHFPPNPFLPGLSPILEAPSV